MRIKIRKSDTIYSRYVRTRAGWRCERCGTQYEEGSRGLDCSHFYGRANESTRFYPDNTFAHCRGCHQFFTSNPALFTEWVKERLGEERYKMLQVVYRTYKKRDDFMDAKYAQLLLDDELKKELLGIQ